MTDQILTELADAVVAMDATRASRAAGRALESGIAPVVAILDGLSKGMERVSELYEAEEYFIPEILLSADAMNAGVDVLRPHLPKESTRDKRKVVIGVVKGDTHDIGKNLVRIMLENGGFEVHDLGRDVAHSRFVEVARQVGADLVCLSTLMTTTMDGMRVVIDELRRAGVAARVMVGGGPISPGFASRIGADGYGRNATEAVRVARSLLGSGPVVARGATQA
ncbi:MAG: corrinoid protein [Deltaproteobacteria bacterium]|nr:corrinoid protein [Deltaproteobacteria bacterium]